MGQSSKTEIDIEHNLNSYPYPLRSASFKAIYSSHVMEHLREPHRFLSECFSLLKSGGILRLNLPNARTLATWYLAGRIPIDNLTEQLRSFKPGGHRHGLDAQLVEIWLLDVGFHDVEEKAVCVSRSHEMRDSYFSTRPGRSFRIEGVKP